MNNKTTITNNSGQIIDVYHGLVECRSCINCINFYEEAEICGNYNQRPPARIIATGCQEWEQDIPF